VQAVRWLWPPTILRESISPQGTQSTQREPQGR
jgi:hypothetical protein